MEVINKAGIVYKVRKYILDSDLTESIWCDEWYGRHVIGQDCEWYAKAKELQAAEQCKWAVVDKEKIFDTEEDARECCLFFWDYTIVKIIEP